MSKRAIRHQGNVLRKVAFSLDLLNGFFLWLVCLFTAFIALSVTMAVAVRAFFGDTVLFGWVTEMSEYGLFLITLLGSAWVLHNDQHVRMDIIVAALKGRKQSLVYLSISVIGAIVCLAFAWFSCKATWVNFAESTTFQKAIGLPKGPIMLSMPIAGVLLFAEFMRQAYGYWRATKGGDETVVTNTVK